MCYFPFGNEWVGTEELASGAAVLYCHLFLLFRALRCRLLRNHLLLSCHLSNYPG